MTAGEAGPAGDLYDWYQRGLELLAQRHPAAAVELLTRAAAEAPESRSIREALARAQFDAGRFTEAAESFAAIVAEHPSDDYAQFGLGLAAIRNGEFDIAVEHLALAVAMRPELGHYQRALTRARAARDAAR